MIDAVVDRREMRAFIIKSLDFMRIRISQDSLRCRS